MRIVLDTNVIVAAFAARGLCAEVFEICISDHTIVFSEQILVEVERNLTKKIKVPDTVVQDLIGYIRKNGDIVEPHEMDDSICRDKDDIKIIGTALKGKAQFIITGDDDLLTLKTFGDIRIITPRRFWEILRT